MNLIFGGSNGYASVSWISTWNVPPSYGVSSGPGFLWARKNGRKRGLSAESEGVGDERFGLVFRN
jgi:hypothetical protein